MTLSDKFYLKFEAARSDILREIQDTRTCLGDKIHNVDKSVTRLEAKIEEHRREIDEIKSSKKTSTSIPHNTSITLDKDKLKNIAAIGALFCGGLLAILKAAGVI